MRVLRSVAGEGPVDLLEALTIPDLPRGEVDQTELARTVLEEISQTARAEAHAQGYAVGWAQGRREAALLAEEEARLAEASRVAAETARAAEHAAAVQALGRAAEQVRGLLETLCSTIEEQSTDLAWELTSTLMEAEVSAVRAPAVVRRVLNVLPAVPTGTVRLSPALAADPAVNDLVTLGLVIQADPTLGPADALVEANGAVTDLRVSAAMERVRSVLTDPRVVARTAADRLVGPPKAPKRPAPRPASADAPANAPADAPAADPASDA